MLSACNRALHWLASPANYLRLSRQVYRWSSLIGLVLFLIGGSLALFVLPADYLQGDSYRILFTHVPAAWLSMMIYSLMTIQAIIILVWRIKINEYLLRTAAPIGALMTVLALVTGSIWGKPTWGAWWVWGDPRLMSELILLFIYLNIIAVQQVAREPRTGARIGALLTVIGVVNLPIIHYSVHWWTSLHQSDSIRMTGKLTLSSDMFWVLLIMAIAYTLLFFGVWHLYMRNALLRDFPKLRSS